MNIFLLIAALIAFLLGVAHSGLGEKYIVRRVQVPGGLEAKRATFMKQVIWFGWHLTSVLFFGFGALLLNMALGTRSVLSAKALIGWTFAVCALLSLISTRGKHFSWVLFGAIAGLSFLG